jgi:hypothetical protein
VRARTLKNSFSVGLLLTLCLFSCQKENEKAIILLSPFDLYIPAQTSHVVIIEVNCQSPFGLKQLLIKSRIEGDYSVIELDLSISGKDFYLQYEYMVPDLSYTTSIFLEFELFDASNEKVSNFRVIEVTPSSVYLTETAGHEMFSGNSGKQNAYNLLTGTPIYLHLSDSSDIHIADTTDSQTMINRWISPAGIKFVKFNGFDYANCTNLSAKAAYSTGLKNDFTNVSKGDIYITKIMNQVSKEIYPVIKIVDIIDEPGSESDRYVFNIKK